MIQQYKEEKLNKTRREKKSGKIDKEKKWRTITMLKFSNEHE